MRIKADFSDTVEQQAIPKDVYHAIIQKVETNLDDQGNVIFREGKTKNPMMTLTCQIDEGEYANTSPPTKIGNINVMLGGTTQKGAPMPLFMLANLVESTRCKASCGSCSADLTGKLMYRGTGKDGYEAGHYYCPECKAKAIFEFDSDDLLGLPCRIAVDVEKAQGSDRDRNTVKKFLREDAADASA